MIRGVKEFIAKKKLGKIGKNRKSHAYNYQTSDLIGVVSFCDSETQYNLILRYIQKLKETHGIRKIVFLVLCSENELPSYVKESETVIGINKKDFTYTGNSENARFGQFLKEKFNILLDFSREVNTESEFVVKSSQASFKVGRFADQNKEMYDFMINLDGSKDLTLFMESLDKYLVMLNPKN